MKIIVSVKQVPDTSGKVAVNPDGTLDRASMQTIINPDDLNAVEAALALKDELGCKVVAFTMGPPPAEGMLREILAMGADEGVLLSDRVLGGSDCLATSTALAAAIKHLGEFDLILCGKQAVDGDTAQVGPEIAEHLGIPQITGTLSVKYEDGKFIAVRENESYSMTMACAAPLLITVTKSEKEPRFASIKGKMKARKAVIPTLTAEAIGLDPAVVGLKGSPTNIFKSFTPPQKGAGMMLEGADKATTDKLAGILAAKHII